MPAVRDASPSCRVRTARRARALRRDTRPAAGCSQATLSRVLLVPMQALSIVDPAIFVEALYVSAKFYREVLELEQVAFWDRFAVFRAGES